MEMNYYNFAKDDYKYFVEDYNNGRVANYLASMSQNICERFLKHIIDEYFNPEEEQQNWQKNDVLRTHNLNKLLKFIEKEMDISIDEETKISIMGCNGYYFSARYPGEESYMVDKDDIDSCYKAVTTCKEWVDKTINDIEKEIEEEERREEFNNLLNPEIEFTTERDNDIQIAEE